MSKQWNGAGLPGQLPCAFSSRHTYRNFNGSNFGLLPSFIHRMTGVAEWQRSCELWHNAYSVITAKWDKNNCLSNMARYREWNIAFRGSLTSTCHSVLVASAKKQKNALLLTAVLSFYFVCKQNSDFQKSHVSCLPSIFLPPNHFYTANRMRLWKRVQPHMIIIYIATHSRHSVDRAGWQAKMASNDFEHLRRGRWKKNCTNSHKKRKGGGSRDASHCPRSASAVTPSVADLRMRKLLTFWRQMRRWRRRFRAKRQTLVVVELFLASELRDCSRS